MLHKEFAQALNVVIIVKTNMQTGARARVILFLKRLESELWPNYWVLPVALPDWIQLPWCETVLGFGRFHEMSRKRLWPMLPIFPCSWSTSRICSYVTFERKTQMLMCWIWRHTFVALKYVTETLKWLPKKPKPILMARIINKVSLLGRVHNPLPSYFPSWFGEGIGTNNRVDFSCWNRVEQCKFESWCWFKDCWPTTQYCRGGKATM